MTRIIGDKSPQIISRRLFLSYCGLATLASPTAPGASWPNQDSDPQIRVSDLSWGQTLLTPNMEFFVRDHFAIPHLDAQDWRLRVTGRVRSPLELTLADIFRESNRNLTATLECAGNGVGMGGVSSATWTGISLKTILNRAGLSPGVKQIRLVGADHGIESPLETLLSFVRSIPLEKALHPDTLVAFRMNGVPLPEEHGFPLRAIVPGWYGMDSVKWLIRIEAIDHEDTSYFMTRRYVAVRLQPVGSEQYPITSMRVKSQIARPRQGEVLVAGAYTIRGAAWAGENRVAQVEVSTNGGKSWAIATLEELSHPYTWTFWRYRWIAEQPGPYTVTVRATDDQGKGQPSARDPRRMDTYEMNWYHSVLCEVR